MTRMAVPISGSARGTGSQLGFTLIEMIFSMVLFGIIGVFSGLFIVRSLEGYILSNSNLGRTQKVQSALTRLAIEMENLTTISNYSNGGSSVTYTTRPKSTDPDIVRSVNLVNNEVKIIDGSTPPARNTGNTLIDGVGEFRLNYFEVTESGVLLNWGGSQENLYLIEIQIVLNATGPYDSATTFVTSITPRRNGHWDGAFDWNR